MVTMELISEFLKQLMAGLSMDVPVSTGYDT
jgi:hypothetical protein